MLAISRKCCRGSLSSLVRLGSTQLNSQQLRDYSDSDKCKKSKKESKCGAAILREYPCNIKPSQPYKAKAVKTKPPLVSMWKIEDCEPELCVIPLRYDMKYYRISDKEKRKYQVTWNECPRLIIKPRKVCVNEKVRRPKIKRRKRSQTGGSAPATAVSCGQEMKKSKCVYIKAPCCKIGRRPPKCKSAFPSLGNCEKRKAPYPSFSECKKDPVPDLPPTECKCLDLPALCDAWAVLRRRIARGQNAIKKCGDA